MNERVYASIMLAAFLPFVIIFVLLWRYCVGVFSDSILQSATESFRSRQDQLQTLADDYLDFKTPPHEPETNATIGNELIFLMADILPPRFLMLQGGAGYLPPWAIKKI